MSILQQTALNLSPPIITTLNRSSLPINSSTPRISFPQNQNLDWKTLQLKLKCRGRCSCFFSDNSRKEQAKQALESALGGKKGEFEKWNKEIQKRELDDGGASGGGGWFGWGGWFGGSNGDHFWNEAQQAGLVILGFIFMYLLLAKGDVLLAVIFNPLLFAFRGIRNLMTYIWSLFWRTVSPNQPYAVTLDAPEEVQTRLSAKESVIRKWGSD